ncbi:DUF5597 domain-containing protein [Chryseolinea sp. T2]|uniref:DUF5597 domain-containing protein n=1 Tax=Chryseolinea sp. T2 TaxID=3129255 RepID=UPI0030775472
MINRLTALLFCFLSASAFGQKATSQKPTELPRVVTDKGTHNLIVDGKPFLLLGAQLWNSSAWPYITDQFWLQLRSLNANTLEVPIYWQNIEPQPGQFNFKELDDLIQHAQQEHIKLVLLWFASWKNGTSSYAPAWLLEDPAKYPRMNSAAGDELLILSPVSTANRDADKRAFVELMKRVRSLDASGKTVIMVQVQNEAGSLGTNRDYSPAANKLYAQEVPSDLVKALNKSAGTWEQVFGIDAPEAFNSWHFATYINEIAKAGKAVHNLPMYANSWTRENSFQRPGEYPSGGPSSNMLDLWKFAAPDLSFLAPDLYFGNPNMFNISCELYKRKDNLLMIPETGNGVSFARFHFYAIGNHDAKGVAVYGVDPFHADPNDKRNFTRLDERFDDIAANYALLSKAADQILALQGQQKLKAVGEEQGLMEQLVHFDGYDVLFEYGYPRYREKGRQSGRALIGQLSANEFLIVGFDARFRFRPTYGSGFSNAEMIAVEEGYYDTANNWVRQRFWNGDEVYHSTLRPQGTILKIRLRPVKASDNGKVRANFEQN